MLQTFPQGESGDRSWVWVGQGPNGPLDTSRGAVVTTKVKTVERAWGLRGTGLVFAATGLPGRLALEGAVEYLFTAATKTEARRAMQRMCAGQSGATCRAQVRDDVLELGYINVRSARCAGHRSGALQYHW